MYQRRSENRGSDRRPDAPETGEFGVPSAYEPLETYREAYRSTSLEDFCDRLAGPFLVLGVPEPSVSELSVDVVIPVEEGYGSEGGGTSWITLGRGRGADIHIAERHLSRVHALLRPGEEGTLLVDAGSANGTRVEGEALPPEHKVRLTGGERLSFGGHVEGRFHTSRTLWKLLHGPGSA